MSTSRSLSVCSWSRRGGGFTDRTRQPHSDKARPTGPGAGRDLLLRVRPGPLWRVTISRVCDGSSGPAFGQGPQRQDRPVHRRLWRTQAVRAERRSGIRNPQEHVHSIGDAAPQLAMNRLHHSIHTQPRSDGRRGRVRGRGPASHALRRAPRGAAVRVRHARRDGRGQPVLARNALNGMNLHRVTSSIRPHPYAN
jgi:hypothetical protein